MPNKPIRTEPEILADIEMLTATPGYLNTLAAISYTDFCGYIEDLSTRNLYENLNYNEMALLMGYWAKNADLHTEEVKAPDDAVTKKTYKLLKELHQCIFSQGIKTEMGTGEKMNFELDFGKNLKEAFFYAGTGGFDLQYMKWIVSKYERDRIWLLDKKKIDLYVIPAFFTHVRQQCQQQLDKYELGLNEGRPGMVQEVFIFEANALNNNNPRFQNIIDNLTITKEEAAQFSLTDVGDFNKFMEKPIVKLADGKLFIPVPYFIMEALWESPYYWMAADKQYQETAFENRGDAAEEIVYQQAVKVFGQEQVYKNVIIKAGKNRVTDIDILAISGDQALIFQIKAKKLTSLSKKGNIEAIRDDFKKAAGKAYEQALISKRAILDSANFSFQWDGKKTLVLNQQKYNCNIILISLDNYPAIAHQTNIFFDKDLPETPMVVNVFDFEAMTTLLQTPAKLIDYIEKRTKFSRYYRSDNEMAFLGFHLKNDLIKHKKADVIYLNSSWGQHIDVVYGRLILFALSLSDII